MVWFGYDWYKDNEIPRYKRQMENVEFLLLDTVKKKTDLNMDIDQLRIICDTLFEWRIMD